MLEGNAKIKSHPADRDWMKSISKGSERVNIMEEAGHLVGYLPLSEAADVTNQNFQDTNDTSRCTW